MPNAGTTLVITRRKGKDLLVQFERATVSSDDEWVSFAVSVPRDGSTTLTQLQRAALARAIELLDIALKGGPKATG